MKYKNVKMKVKKTGTGGKTWKKFPMPTNSSHKMAITTEYSKLEWENKIHEIQTKKMVIIYLRLS